MTTATQILTLDKVELGVKFAFVNKSGLFIGKGKACVITGKSENNRIFEVYNIEDNTATVYSILQNRKVIIL